MELISKRGGIGKILVWIIIILVVLAIIVIVYSYMTSDNDTGDDGIGGTGEEDLGGEESNPPTVQEYVNEKPPIPPE